MQKILFEEEKWAQQQIFFDGDEYFPRLIEALNSAKKSIDFETYIFADDIVGKQVVHALLQAAERGVAVRLLVDGVGAGDWAMIYGPTLCKHQVEVKIYHPPAHLLWFSSFFIWKKRFSATQLLLQINRRNHRKVCIVDHEFAFVGSCNVTKDHLSAEKMGGNWHDVVSKVYGRPIYCFLETFDRVWRNSWSFGKKGLRPRRFYPPRPSVFHSALVILNNTALRRHKNYYALLKRIVLAKERVWIENPYFVPSRSFIRALQSAQANGAEVCIVVPKKNDLFFMPWVSSAFIGALIKRQVKVYEYQARFIHAKTMIIDKWASVGSTNLNQRSLLHDLEADVIVTDETSFQRLCSKYLEVFKESKVLTKEDLLKMRFWERILGRLLLMLKYLL